MKQTVTRGKATKPNPKALAELHARFVWWLAKREIQKRAEQPRNERRSSVPRV